MKNALRVRRDLTDDAFCKGCGVAQETILHVLRDYFLARKVWDQLLPKKYGNQLYTLQEGERLVSNILQGRKFYLGNEMPSK